MNNKNRTEVVIIESLPEKAVGLLNLRILCLLAFSISAGLMGNAQDFTLTRKIRSVITRPSNQILVGTENGVFYSSNNGDAWVHVITGLNDPNVWSMVLSPKGPSKDFVFAGTDFYVYESSQTLTSAVDKRKTEIPFSFLLDQNYPNPFNPSTVIEFSLPRAMIVTLKVYNILGEEVAMLVNGMRNPSRQSVVWSAGQLSSGVYFYRLETSALNLTRKLVLLR
ncbi:MAG: T9SS type A sorting domain-containing protein [Ignavibacteria bacterium]|nr:MAG: T9SS type A sorting domain-containing protein [Ignavibacteria bacterium]